MNNYRCAKGKFKTIYKSNIDCFQIKVKAELIKINGP